MKPLKSGLSFANWLLRFAILYFVMVQFVGVIKGMNFSNKEFWFGLSFALTSLFLFIGGFFGKPAITVVSGFLLSGLSIYKLIISFSGELNATLSTYLVILAVAFYFVCAGNNK